MMAKPVALWFLGPPGSGKSFAIARLAGWQIVSQDQELERLLAEHRLPLDTRMYTPAMAAQFTELRAQASVQTWNEVPDLRRSGQPIVYESTGDKPTLLAVELEHDRQAGYLSLGIGVDGTLEDCLRGNRQRRRVLPEVVVSDAWHTFQQHLADGTYPALFGEQNFRLLGRDDAWDIQSWAMSNGNRLS
jgi:hypothetical protein